MLHIVLFEPEIPQNTGNIGRTCAALGATLHIIRPIPFSLNEKAARRAGLDYWEHLTLEIHDSLADFMEKYGQEHLFFIETHEETVYTDISYPENSFLVFGPETRGLPADLLDGTFGPVAYIPMVENIRSLNVSNAVALVAYEVVRQRGLGNL